MVSQAREFLDLLKTADASTIQGVLDVEPSLAHARDDAWGDAAILVAIARDDPSLVGVLLAAGASVREPTVPLNDTRSGSPPFTFARSVAVAAVLERAGTLWTDPDDGARALATAARAANVELLRWLVERGARPSLAAFQGADYAPEFVEVLFEVCPPDVRQVVMVDCLGLDSSGRDRDPGLCLAIVDRCLQDGADPRLGDALHRAAANNLSDIVQRLLLAGDDPNRATEYGELPLIEAAYEGAHAAARVLVRAGADPDRSNAHGQTARLAAVELDDEDLAAILSAG